MAQLGDLILPNTFRHAPYVPGLRYSVTPTATGAVMQRAATIIHGDGVIEWTAEGLCFTEFCQLNQLYYGQGPYEFLGNWNEDVVVEFVRLNATSLGGGYLSVTGSFVVMCVNDPACGGTYY